ncbi:hypothetical protein [Yersinia enterocolitica]|uniref:hypothetical protein n=1 Tax=Yersinia enterocolitica TaxID=630 RepID=UPI0021E81B52|nr:hypothetical protein [Yersinia enterocolitica]UYJ99067.1 hypothetical protein N4W06_08455 [Yersinia enterocolitica]
MMDITKSQSDFEAWWNAPEQAELRNSCAMGWGFRIWKAARESIEVELPKRQSIYASGYGDGYFVPNISGEGLEYDEVVEAIRTAGIRIKGESE